jgi:hypothetical protein
MAAPASRFPIRELISIKTSFSLSHLAGLVALFLPSLFQILCLLSFARVLSSRLMFCNSISSEYAKKLKPNGSGLRLLFQLQNANQCIIYHLPSFSFRCTKPHEAADPNMKSSCGVLSICKTLNACFGPLFKCTGTRRDMKKSESQCDFHFNPVLSLTRCDWGGREAYDHDHSPSALDQKPPSTCNI